MQEVKYRHRHIWIDGVDVVFCEAGPPESPIPLLTFPDRLKAGLSTGWKLGHEAVENGTESRQQPTTWE